ncbi:MAG: (2Fe-2S)-binding protein [Rubrivivax sp.]|jgi:bacterioferritin-associated ferredoxin|nr:(2Fe-2S)-binding protein [Rubrivivax sp.]
MIVCLCHRVSDRDIQVAVNSGTLTFDDLQDELRVASACGCCQDSAREVFDRVCCGGGTARAGVSAAASAAAH